MKEITVVFEILVSKLLTMLEHLIVSGSGGPRANRAGSIFGHRGLLSQHIFDLM